MTTINVFVLLAFLCLVSIIPLFVFGHEFSHIYFNDFRWSGYCFLNCPNTSESVYTGFGGKTDSPSSPPIIGVFLNKPYNNLATDESIANGVGFVFASSPIIGLVFLFLCLWKTF
jgi:hypothetical protein